MKALILAAGEGNRFRELTKQKPKAILQIAGMPLLGRILRGLKEAGIQDVWIVVGYKADLLRKEFGEKYAGLMHACSHLRNASLLVNRNYVSFSSNRYYVRL